MQYTVEVYKKDSRCKSGERRFDTFDYAADSLEQLTAAVERKYPAPKFRTAIHKTFVTRRNAMTGAEFQERYDTPYYCSPSSDAYWSM